MSTLTQFRHYLISQDAAGTNIEIARSADQVGVLAFDSQRLAFVNCHVLLEPLKNRRAFDERVAKLSAVGHPLRARVLEAGEDEGSPYYITQNVDGETLREYFARHEQFPVWLAVRLTWKALDAMECLASRGDYVTSQPLEMLRVVQTGPQNLVVVVADYRLAESGSAKASRGRLVKSAFEKQGQFLTAFFKEQGRSGAEALLGTSDFVELLENLLLSCGPETVDAISALRQSLEAVGAQAPVPEIPAPLKPRPLIAPLLASFQEVARSVVHSVRMQSQRLDGSQPYVLRGSLMKSGQNVNVSQVPPLRLAGSSPAEALRHARMPPKPGKFPNLVPLVFVEEREGVECMAETAVEGITLGELLEVRGSLDAHESYLVLAGVDAALGQLEKANRATRRLRLDDIFLFTGFGNDKPGDPALLQTKLNDWPGFSIVLRAHPCTHAMAGRGLDPAILLPLDPKSKADAEAIWNGGWMSALGAQLVGMDETGRKLPFSPGMTSVADMLRDELASARKGAPSSRATFLARFVRVMREHDLAQVKPGGFWQELSGNTTAPGQAAPVVRAASPPAVAAAAAAALPAPEQTAEAEVPQIGFAEALIQRAQPGGRGRSRDGGGESSWTGFREAKPLWITLTKLGVGSILLGALLAHMQGRGFWQARFFMPEPSAAAVPEKPAPETAESKASPSVPALPAPKTPMLADVNLDPVPRKGSVPGAPSDAALSARLREIRRKGDKLPDDLRATTESAANQGVTEAMIALGNAALRGVGGPVDESAAFAWFDKALQAGDKTAMVPLASCYLQGWGIPPDFTRAVSLLNRAANDGNSDAKDMLGVCYARGLGVQRDDSKAFQFCTEAYKAGVPSACGNLGAMYLRGQGTRSDATRAAALFAEGAGRGHAESMLLYAQCLENGNGTAANVEKAADWYLKAARAGNAEAAAWCQRKGLTP